MRINEELSPIHKVLDNLEYIQGVLLRINRLIQAEGAFGIMKYDQWYKRMVRRGLESVKLEFFSFQSDITFIKRKEQGDIQEHSFLRRYQAV